MKHSVSQNPDALTERVEAIVFTNSALPASPSADALREIICSLDTEKYSKQLCTGHVFGEDSLCSRINNLLISKGCPSSSLVENSFTAAAAHSDLGKMLHWFARSIIQLFVHGVNSGVQFPEEWEKAVQQNPTLSRYSFELQGFSILYTYVLCHLAAVETTLAAKNPPSECAAQEKNHSKTVVANEMSVNEVNESKESKSEITVEAARQNCGTHPVVEKVVDLVPEIQMLTKSSLKSPICVAWDSPSPGARMKEACISLGSAPLPPTAPLGEMRVLPLSANSAIPPKPRVEARKLHKGIHAHHHVRLPEVQQQQQEQMRSSSRNKVVRDLKQGMPSLTVPLLEICSKGFNPTGGAEPGGHVLPMVRESLAKSPIESHSIKKRMVINRPCPLKVETIEEEQRARELRRAYGVKNIVNYSKRDAKTCGDNVKFLREILDAKFDDMSEVADDTGDHDMVRPVIFP